MANAGHDPGKQAAVAARDAGARRRVPDLPELGEVIGGHRTPAVRRVLPVRRPAYRSDWPRRPSARAVAARAVRAGPALYRFGRAWIPCAPRPRAGSLTC